MLKMLLLAAWLNLISITVTPHSLPGLFNRSFTKIIIGRNVKRSTFDKLLNF